MAAALAAPLQHAGEREHVAARAYEAGLFHALSSGAPRSLPELRAQLGLPEEALSPLLADLQRCGLVKRVDLGPGGKEHGFVWAGGPPGDVLYHGNSGAPGSGAATRRSSDAGGFDQFGKAGSLPGYVAAWPPMVPYMQPVQPMPVMYMQPPFYGGAPGGQAGTYGPPASRGLDGRPDNVGAPGMGMGVHGAHRPGNGHYPVGLRGFAGGEPAKACSVNGGTATTGWAGLPLPSSPNSGAATSISDGSDGGKKSANGSARQPCSFFLKTGTCAYGDKCKFDHPLDRVPLVRFNSVGLPMRPGEPDCTFFMKNLRCGFGASCKFNHPEPYNMAAAAQMGGAAQMAAAAAAAAAGGAMYMSGGPMHMPPQMVPYYMGIPFAAPMQAGMVFPGGQSGGPSAELLSGRLNGGEARGARGNAGAASSAMPASTTAGPLTTASDDESMLTAPGEDGEAGNGGTLASTADSGLAVPAPLRQLASGDSSGSPSSNSADSSGDAQVLSKAAGTPMRGGGGPRRKKSAESRPPAISSVSLNSSTAAMHAAH